MQSLTFWDYLLLATSAALTGAFSAFLLAAIRDQIAKRKRIKGYLSSLGAEIDECHRIATRYSPTHIASPLYRLPAYFYQQALPGLLADGKLLNIESKALLLFYAEVETANRGLDRVDLLLTQGTLQATPDDRTHSPAEIPQHVDRAIWAEYGRVTLKMRRINRLYPRVRVVASTPRSGFFQGLWTILTDALDKMLPTNKSYLKACERAGRFVSNSWRTFPRFYRKIRNLKTR